MKYETIMGKIAANLSGDPNQDIPYLQKQAEKYKKHKLSQELLHGIGLLLDEVQPEDKKPDGAQAVSKDDLGIEAVLKEARLQMFERDYDGALALLEGMAAKIEGLARKFENDRGSDYFYFDNPMEEGLYRELYKPTKETRILPENYADIYLLYGVLLVELNRIEEAESAFRKASGWNPIEVETLFELGEIYKKNQEYEQYLEITGQCLERAYKREDIARCYRNLGFYNIYQNNFELAIALYCYSMEFSEDDDRAEAELEYIAQKMDQDVYPPSFERLQELFAENGIQLGANELVLQTAIKLGNQAMGAKDYAAARYFYSIFYELTGHEQVRSMIDSLSNAVN